MNPIFHTERIGLISHWGESEFFLLSIRKHKSDKGYFIGLCILGIELIVWND